MSKYKDPDVRKQLSIIFTKLAERIEQDEEFAEWIFEGIKFTTSKNSNRKQESNNIKVKSVVSERSPLPDIFTMFSMNGSESLREQLNTYETELLIKIVLENGLDPVK